MSGHEGILGLAILFGGYQNPDPIVAVSRQEALVDFLRDVARAPLGALLNEGQFKTGSLRQEARMWAALTDFDEDEFEIANRLARRFGNALLENCSWVLMEHKGEIPLYVIRQIGIRLRKGESYAAVAKAEEVDARSVKRIDEYFGFHEARESALLDEAREAVEDGVSVREFAAEFSLSYRQANRLMSEARAINEELEGEYAF